MLAVIQGFKQHKCKYLSRKINRNEKTELYRANVTKNWGFLSAEEKIQPLLDRLFWFFKLPKLRD